MSSIFKGKVALVTGGGSGIGAAVCKLLAAGGAAVLVSDIHADHAEAVAREIVASGGQAACNTCDVASPEQVRDAVDQAVREFGALHLAVNNAGISGVPLPAAELPIDDWRKVIDVNLNAVFYGLHYQIPAILAAGGGAIVNVSSVLGLVGQALAPAYISAKHGVTGLTKATAIAYAQKGLRVNSVHPGYIDTPMLDVAPPELRKALVARHPIGRLGTPEEIAQVIAFLLSDAASFVTGAQYTADGAYTAQ